MVMWGMGVRIVDGTRRTFPAASWHCLLSCSHLTERRLEPAQASSSVSGKGHSGGTTRTTSSLPSFRPLPVPCSPFRRGVMLQCHRSSMQLSDKWRPLRNLSRVTSCIGVAGVSVAGNSSVASVRRHGGRGEVGDVEGTASAGAEESFGKQLEIRRVPAGVRPRFKLEDQGRSTTSSSKRRHHMVSGSATAPQPLYAAVQNCPLFCRKCGGCQLGTTDL